MQVVFEPREQFRAFHAREQRWACIVAHRRAGKTVAAIADLIRDISACDKREPRGAYIAPTYAQAKDIAWAYLKRMTAPIPGITVSESELSVTLPHNQGRVRLYGAENYDRLRGLYLDACILDEPADIDPRAWPEVIRPALADRKGRATFIGTPKGRNAFFDLWQHAQKDEAWFALMLKASETGLVEAEELESLRTLLTPEQYAQEMECSFEAAVRGAYYGREMIRAEEEGRITGVPYEPTAQVFTAWDLGISDQTAIWFAQTVGREVHIIDYYEASGVGIDHYVQALKAKPYIYAGHIVPHDAQARELGTGKTRVEVMQSLGLQNVLMCPQHSVEDGINGVRSVLPKMWWDKAKCARGLECLRMYRADFDDKLGVLKPKPVHDWASHGADAFRYLAMGLDYYAGVSVETRAIDRYRRKAREGGRSSSWAA